MGLSIPAIVEKHAAFALEQAMEFPSLFEEKYSEEMNRLRSLAGDEDEGIEFYADEAWLLDSLLDDAWSLTVVSLYRNVELNTKKILGWRFGSGSKEANTYRIDDLKKLLRGNPGILLHSVPGFNQIDALREVNNSFKHAGGMNAKVAKILGGKAGEKLPRLDNFAKATAPFVSSYLGALAREVVPKKNGGNHP